jgi:HK97 family phage portal protein
MTAQVGREVLEAHVLAWGNGYAEKVYNGQGDLVELWPIPPNRCDPVIEDGELLYDIDVGGEKKRFTREKILHVPGLGFDGFTGYSVIAMARESIGLGMAMEKFGAKFFGNGAHLGVVVTHPKSLTEKAEDNIKRSFIEKQSGLDNAHRMLFLQEGMTVSSLGLPPEDSQFIEGRQFQITDIARWFNIPPHKLKDMTKSSFSNIESEQTSFVIDSILPRCVRLESNFGMQLLSDLEQRQGYYFNHNLAGLLRGDSEARAKFYTAMFNVGALSPDDIREKEDFDPLPDGIGDRYFVQLNMAPLDKIDEVRDDSKSQEVVQPGDGKQAGDKQEQRSNLISLR